MQRPGRNPTARVRTIMRAALGSWRTVLVPPPIKFRTTARGKVQANIGQHLHKKPEQNPPPRSPPQNHRRRTAHEHPHPCRNSRPQHRRPDPANPRPRAHPETRPTAAPTAPRGRPTAAGAAGAGVKRTHSPARHNRMMTKSQHPVAHHNRSSSFDEDLAHPTASKNPEKRKNLQSLAHNNDRYLHTWKYAFPD